MENQSVYAVFDDCRPLEDTKLFFHYNNAKKCFDTVVSENEPEGNASLVGLTIEDAAGINEYDNPTDASENFVKAKKILADVDIETIAKTCKAITLFVNNLQPEVSCVCEKDNRYSAIQDVKKMFDVRNSLLTNERCPKCGKRLYLSDLPQYDYVCPWCDENF
jgi:hypothetical protein